MSFFDALVQEFTPAAGGTNWLAYLAPAAAVVYGGVTSNQANVEAARISAEATQRAADAIAAGNAQAQERFGAITTQTAPARSYLRNVLAQPADRLTPEQQRTLDEVNRTTANSLAVTGLRGAGRAQVAAIKDVVGGTRDRMIDVNRSRSDAAANQLSGDYVNAATNAARLDQDTGKAVGEAITKTGETVANVGTVNVANRGKTIADVTSLISSGLKEQGRESRYRERVARRTTDQEERV